MKTGGNSYHVLSIDYDIGTTMWSGISGKKVWTFLMHLICVTKLLEAVNLILQLRNNEWAYHFLHYSASFENYCCIKVKYFVTLMVDTRVPLKEGTDFV